MASGRTRSERIAGYPMADMRALLRRDRGDGFTFEEALALSGRHDGDLITGMITGLVAEGFLVQIEADRWQCTDKGRAMQWTSRERVTQDKVEQRLAEVVARASVINADDNWLSLRSSCSARSYGQMKQ